MNNPKISVLLASYNHERFIKKSIESVLNQTFTDIEVIIVDDGSKDSSKQIIESYKDNRIKAFFFEHNKGMSESFNFAVKQARGEYLARLDSDDFWELDKLEKQYEFMEKNREYGACFTWTRIVDEYENTVPSHLCENRDISFNSKNRTSAEWVHDLYFKGCCLCHPTAFIRTEVMNLVGEYTYSMRQIQDLDLWMRIAKISKLYILEEKLVNYRWITENGNNVSAHSPTVEARGRFEWFDLCSTYFDDISDEMLLEGFREKFKNPLSESKEELICERAFILLLPTLYSNDSRIIGLQKLGRLLQDEKIRNLLLEKYKFTPNNLYQITGSIHLFYPFGISDIVESKFTMNKSTFKEKIKKFLKKYPIVFNFLKKHLKR